MHYFPNIGKKGSWSIAVTDNYSFTFKNRDYFSYF